MCVLCWSSVAVDLTHIIRVNLTCALWLPENPNQDNAHPTIIHQGNYPIVRIYLEWNISK